MAQYSTRKGSLLNTNDTLYEVVMIAGKTALRVDIVTGNHCGGGAIFDLILR